MNWFNNIITLMERWLFLFGKTNKDQVLAYDLLARITQWLNQNPDYNLESLIDFIIEWEEDLLNDSNLDLFDTIQKEFILSQCYIILNFIDSYDYTLENQEISPLQIFTRDPLYYELTIKVLEFIRVDYYTEIELYDYLRNLRRKEYKQYNWKTNMLKAGEI